MLMTRHFHRLSSIRVLLCRERSALFFVKEVASDVAKTEAKRRGWQNWDLGYIQERDQGWMHVVIAEVTRKNAAENTSSSTQ